MFRLLKTLLVIIKNRHNSISLDSDISTDIQIGRNNNIRNSTIYNSKIADNCVIKKASVFSSQIAAHVNLNPEVILFSTKISDHVYAGNRSAISNSRIGRYSYLAGNNRIFNTHINSFCSIAENVCIGHAEHPYQQFSTSPIFYKKDNPFGTEKFFQKEVRELSSTNVGNDVWIGYNAYIRSGVIIGNGCVIGTGAVVTKNIEPYSIVAGVPAKVIKKRFDDKIILKLEQDKWWDLKDTELIRYAKENFLDLSNFYKPGHV